MYSIFKIYRRSRIFWDRNTRYTRCLFAFLYIFWLSRGRQKERGKIHFNKHMFSRGKQQIPSTNPSSNNHRRNLLVLNDWKLSLLSNDTYKICWLGIYIWKQAQTLFFQWQHPILIWYFESSVQTLPRNEIWWHLD